MPKSKPDDAGNIRSLSAPSVQVRHTKTSFLRKVFSVNNADLAFLVNPPMGETNPTVVGQNKSVAKTMEKNVNTWYRERTYHTERLSRMEDEVYEKLCILERKKQNILRSTDASLERSATGIGGQFTHGEDMSELVETENGVVNGEAENETGTGLSQVERPPIGDANSQQPSKTAVKFSAQPEEANNERDAFAKDNSRAKSGEDAKNTVTKKTSKFETVLETSVKVNHDGDSKSVRVNYLAPRPTTQGALVTARENDETSVPRPLTQIGRLPSTTTESKPVFHRENSAANGKSSRQSRSMLNIHQPGHSASPRPPPLIGDKFIYWKKEKNGKIMQSDLPYKRREFEVPAERDDAGRKKKLLYKEQTSVRASLDKYASLSHNIDKLGKFAYPHCALHIGQKYTKVVGVVIWFYGLRTMQKCSGILLVTMYCNATCSL